MSDADPNTVASRMPRRSATAWLAQYRQASLLVNGREAALEAVAAAQAHAIARRDDDDGTRACSFF